MKQIRACPKANIKFIKEAMHSRKTASNELFDLRVVGECHIIIKAKESEDEATKDMCRWVDSDLLKKDTIATYRCTDTTIKNIMLKGVSNTTHNLKQGFLSCKLIRSH